METLGPPGPTVVRRPAARPGTPGVRLTGRGAVCGLFLACFLAMLLVNVTGWTAFGDLVFVTGCGAAAWFTRRGSLLAVAVTPPVIFFAASLAASLITVSGTFSLLTSLLVRLGTSAPWLFAGTGTAIGIGTFRGLPEEVADFVADLRGLVR